MSETIIDCERNHAAAITAIVNHSIETSCSIYDLRPRTVQSTQDWIQMRVDQGLPVKGLVDAQGKLLGYGSFAVFRPFEAYWTTVEHSLYVHHEHQRFGYGSRILAVLIQVAKSQGRHSMIGGIDSTNEPSIRLHQKFGFHLCGEIKEVARKFDRWLDLHFYQLRFTAPDASPQVPDTRLPRPW